MRLLWGLTCRRLSRSMPTWAPDKVQALPMCTHAAGPCLGPRRCTVAPCLSPCCHLIQLSLLSIRPRPLLQGYGLLLRLPLCVPCSLVYGVAGALQLAPQLRACDIPLRPRPALTCRPKGRLGCSRVPAGGTNAPRRGGVLRTLTGLAPSRVPGPRATMFWSLSGTMGVLGSHAGQAGWVSSRRGLKLWAVIITLLSASHV